MNLSFLSRRSHKVRPKRRYRPQVDWMEDRSAPAVFAGGTDGLFRDPTPVGAVTDGEGTDTFLWGDPGDYGTGSNWMHFAASNFQVVPNQVFSLGRLSYFNGTTVTGTAASTVVLDVNVSLTSPGSFSDQTFPYDLRMVTTTNTGNPTADADFVLLNVPRLPKRIVLGEGGDKIGLEVLGFANVAGGGFVYQNQFRVLEGRSASAALLGRFVLPDVHVVSVQATGYPVVGGTSVIGVNYDSVNLSGNMFFCVYQSADRVFTRVNDTPLASQWVDVGPGSEGYAEFTVRLPNRPAGYVPGQTVTFLLVVADPWNRVPESNEANNMAVLPVSLPDLRPYGASFAAPSGTASLLTFSYDSTGLAGPVVFGIFQSTDRVYTPGVDRPLAFRTFTVEPGTGNTADVTITHVPYPHAIGPIFVVIVADLYNTVAERNEANNTWAMSLAEIIPLSVELESAAPIGNTRRDRVELYLRAHRTEITDAATRWNIDARAIAGAIAYEALYNSKPAYSPPAYPMFVGPGKVHLYEIGRLSLAQQVERLHYFGPTPVSYATMKAVCKSVGGAATYIGAIMRAFVDKAVAAGTTRGALLANDPAVLASLYQGIRPASYNGGVVDLYNCTSYFVSQDGGGPIYPGMGAWVVDNLDYLARALTA